jgi:two-component system response regulator DesR
VETFGADTKLRVLVVDDHDLVRWGFRVLLTQESWVSRVVTAQDIESAASMARRLRPHVAVVDVVLGKSSGTEACQAISEACPMTRLLLVSGAARLTPPNARAAGASGFVSKQWSARDIAGAVRMVGLGMDVFPPVPRQRQGLLSEREHEVLRLMAAGATNTEIGRQLFLSPHTVKDHTTALYRKLKVRNRPEAVVKAQRWGLLE